MLDYNKLFELYSYVKCPVIIKMNGIEYEKPILGTNLNTLKNRNLDHCTRNSNELLLM